MPNDLQDGQTVTHVNNSKLQNSIPQHWYVASSTNRYYDIQSKNLEATSFNRQLFIDHFGKDAPAATAKTNTVSALRYNPCTAERIYTHHGVRYINTFTPETVTQPSGDYNPEHHAIKTIQRHIELLFKPIDQTVITWWLAFNYSRIYNSKTDSLIRWAPIIHSVPGTGKGKLLEVLAAVLGQQNVNTVQNSQLKAERFTLGWADSSAITLFNEVHVTGNKSSRDSVMNSLKATISDDTTVSEGKGSNAKAVDRTANIIAFTNHYDSITIDENDRRWAVIDAQNPNYSSAADRENHLDALTFITRDPESLTQIAAWLLTINTDQYSHQRKPETSGTARQIYDSKSEYAQQIRSIIENGAYGVSEEFVLIPCIQQEAEKQLRSTSANNISKALIELGYTRVSLWTVKYKLRLPERDNVATISVAYLKNYISQTLAKPDFDQRLNNTKP